MIKLKRLSAAGDCGIDEYGIKNLINLEYLYADLNPKITIKLKNKYNG